MSVNFLFSSAILRSEGKNRQYNCCYKLLLFHKSSQYLISLEDTYILHHAIVIATRLLYR